MFQLESTTTAPVLELYRGSGSDFSLVRAVLEGSQRGSVHVDDPESPRLALAVNRFGFGYAFGDAGGGRGEALMQALPADPALTERYLLWYEPPEVCRRAMDALSDGIARARTRIQYRFSEADFRRARTEPAEDVELSAIDAEVLPALEPLGLEIGTRFWESDADFLRGGYGVAARVGGRIASVCYATCVAGGRAEIDVATADDFRGRGLALSVAGAFVEESLRRGIVPGWDCFDTNTASRRLAERLGFHEAKHYPFYSINTNMREYAAS